MNVACQNCGRTLASRRSTARYCGGACRTAAQRKRDRGLPVERAPRLVARLPCASLALQAPPVLSPAHNSADVTLTRQQIWASKSAQKLDRRIVPDAKWPGMYRLRLPDGSLTDMVNLTRAKDALAE
jgi:hypothetical protein